LARLAVAVELARSGEDREAALNRIQKEADRLNALVGELLQVTRAEGDPASLRQEPVPLDELLRGLVDDCSVEAQARHCRIELTATEPAQVRGDPELLRRAIENVIRNAIRHAPAGTAVEVSLRKDAAVSVLVRDYGPGIPKSTCRASSTPSTAWIPIATARAAVSAWAWPSRAGPSNCTKAASRPATRTPACWSRLRSLSRLEDQEILVGQQLQLLREAEARRLELYDHCSSESFMDSGGPSGSGFL